MLKWHLKIFLGAVKIERYLTKQKHYNTICSNKDKGVLEVIPGRLLFLQRGGISCALSLDTAEEMVIILKNFEAYILHFKKVMLTDYREILRLISENEERGADAEEAKIEAFRTFVGGV